MNDKKPCNDFVHSIRFWKGQSFSNKPRTWLSQAVIPTLHVVCLPAAFTNALMCLCWKDTLIRFPEITVALASPIGWWNLLPQFATGGLAAITNYKGYDLACPTTHHRPDPALVPFFVDKWPHFVSFQHIFRFGWQKRIFKLRITFVFFLARKSELDDSHQRCVARHAYLSVPDRQTRFVLFVLQCSHVSVQAHRVFRNLCTHIAGYHSHCDHFWQCFCYRNFDSCTQLV